jgi:hypothetical protein
MYGIGIYRNNTAINKEIKNDQDRDIKMSSMLTL